MRQSVALGIGVTRLAVLVALLGRGSFHAAFAREVNPSVAQASRPRVDFGREAASPVLRQFADWVLSTRNNAAVPFAIVDKVNTKVFVFTAAGRLRGAAPALLGSARGDDSGPGVGDKRLKDVRPEERTTPAGRFVADMGRDLQGQEILWVDYGAAVSLHRVIASNIAEQRAQRLASPTPLDNRITYGCINVSKAFYLRVVHPLFIGTHGIVYVLPETRAVEEVFHGYDAG